LLPANVGQLKKLYTTSCLAVMSWSSSSIKTTLMQEERPNQY
jgi:hypothetical protein